MQILLLKDVGGVGRHGEVKEVSDGYALNHLIPNGLAQQATPEKLKAHAAATQKEREIREREQQALVANIQSLEGARVEIAVRATEKGGLFKSVGASDVRKAIHDTKQLEIPLDAIHLEKPLKEIGEHAIEIKTPGATARIIFAIKKAA